jgi:hypothetical protein
MSTSASAAEILGADVVIITFQLHSTDTIAIAAVVIHSTVIAIITWSGRGNIGTPTLRSAGILRTWIFVITVSQADRHTLALGTSIAEGAGISIITDTVREGVHATSRRLAGIISTWIIIIAGQTWTGNTRPRTATIPYGAGITILARLHIVLMNTPLLRVAEILGTRIIVRTISPPRAATYSVVTGITQGTEIAVITGISVVRRDKFTASAGPVADIFKAK